MIVINGSLCSSEFNAAFAALEKGSQIRRKCWPDGQHLKMQPRGFIGVVRQDRDLVPPWMGPSNDEANAVDWEVEAACLSLVDVLATKIEHDGQRYVTEQATSCDGCVFYWRDGGIYDACDHPNRAMVESMCGAANRKRGVNVIWKKVETVAVSQHVRKDIEPLNDQGTVPTPLLGQRFIDQIDADRVAIAWLKSRPGIEEIRWHNHEHPGRTGSAWRKGRLVAITTVLRDDLNYSVLICHDLAPSVDLADAERHEDVSEHYPEVWGPSDDRRVTCSCGNQDPNHMAPTQNTEKLQAECDAFNAKHAVGADVFVKLDGVDEPFRTRTRSEAQILSGHSAVIWLENVTGCYLLDRVSAA